MINTTIAKRYAKALVQLGSEYGLVDQFRGELADMDGLFSTNKELPSAFSNPAFTAEQKKAIMAELITRSGFSELMGNFLMLLVDKHRVSLLSQIVRTYETLADEESGVIRPSIRTAFALDQGQIAAIQGALEKKTGSTVIPQLTVDTSLLGGVVIQIGDTAYDSTIKTQLERIQDILQKG